MIINRLYETQNLLSLWLVFFLIGLGTYQHPCSWNLNRCVIDGITLAVKQQPKTFVG